MNYSTINTSQSLIGNLCQEIFQLRNRNHTIIDMLKNCENKALRKRLYNESIQLEKRRIIIFSKAKYISDQLSFKSLSVLFLIEVSSRKL